MDGEALSMDHVHATCVQIEFGIGVWCTCGVVLYCVYVCVHACMCVHMRMQVLCISFTLGLLQSKGLFSYAAALPTSLVSSGQQWDFPNGWPPLQWFAIIGMLNANDLSTRKVAHDLTSKWIHTNWKTWKKTGHMYEKVIMLNYLHFVWSLYYLLWQYDARIDGVPGGGGEYNVQVI